MNDETRDPLEDSTTGDHWCLSPHPVGNADMCANLSPDDKHRCSFGHGHKVDYHCCYPWVWPVASERPFEVPADHKLAVANSSPTAPPAPSAEELGRVAFKTYCAHKGTVLEGFAAAAEAVRAAVPDGRAALERVRDWAAQRVINDNVAFHVCQRIDAELAALASSPVEAVAPPPTGDDAAFDEAVNAAPGTITPKVLVSALGSLFESCVLAVEMLGKGESDDEVSGQCDMSLPRVVALRKATVVASADWRQRAETAERELRKARSTPSDDPTLGNHSCRHKGCDIGLRCTFRHDHAGPIHGWPFGGRYWDEAGKEIIFPYAEPERAKVSADDPRMALGEQAIRYTADTGLCVFCEVTASGVHDEECSMASIGQAPSPTTTSDTPLGNHPAPSAAERTAAFHDDLKRDPRDQFVRVGGFHGRWDSHDAVTFTPFDANEHLDGKGDPLPNYCARIPPWMIAIGDLADSLVGAGLRRAGDLVSIYNAKTGREDTHVTTDIAWCLRNANRHGPLPSAEERPTGDELGRVAQRVWFSEHHRLGKENADQSWEEGSPSYRIAWDVSAAAVERIVAARVRDEERRRARESLVTLKNVAVFHVGPARDAKFMVDAINAELRAIGASTALAPLPDAAPAPAAAPTSPIPFRTQLTEYLRIPSDLNDEEVLGHVAERLERSEPTASPVNARLLEACRAVRDIADGDDRDDVDALALVRSAISAAEAAPSVIADSATTEAAPKTERSALERLKATVAVHAAEGKNRDRFYQGWEECAVLLGREIESELAKLGAADGGRGESAAGQVPKAVSSAPPGRVQENQGCSPDCCVCCFAARRAVVAPEVEPIPAVMHCPFCGVQHLDDRVWAKRPHHKHLCAGCGKLWRVEPYIYGVKPPAAPVDKDCCFEYCDKEGFLGSSYCEGHLRQELLAPDSERDLPCGAVQMKPEAAKAHTAMTEAKFVAVVEQMADSGAGAERTAERFHPDVLISVPAATGSNQMERVRRHFRFMAREAGGFMVAARGEAPAPLREKAMRWLGFMQGALWSSGACSIAELAQLNRSDVAKDGAK